MGNYARRGGGEAVKIVSRVIFNRFPEITGKVFNGAVLAVQQTTLEIDADIKGRMQAPKSGRSYQRGGRAHVASAPGEAPAIDMGALINSVQNEFPAPMHGIVFSNLDYPVYLEFGTTRMAARPAWIPAAEAAWPRFLDRMQKIAG